MAYLPFMIVLVVCIAIGLFFPPRPRPFTWKTINAVLAVSGACAAVGIFAAVATWTFEPLIIGGTLAEALFMIVVWMAQGARYDDDYGWPGDGGDDDPDDDPEPRGPTDAEWKTFEEQLRDWEREHCRDPVPA